MTRPPLNPTIRCERCAVDYNISSTTRERYAAGQEVGLVLFCTGCSQRVFTTGGIADTVPFRPCPCPRTEPHVTVLWVDAVIPIIVVPVPVMRRRNRGDLN